MYLSVTNQPLENRMSGTKPSNVKLGYTPPPWTANGVSITAAKGIPIAETKGAYGQPAEANAKLIGAAPDMAEVLRELIEYIELDSEYLRGMIGRARAALAKAGL